jgi:hypothetical protein
MASSAWNDPVFVADGDFLVDGTGDLASLDGLPTVEEGARAAVRQMIVHRVLAETNGWREEPCAGLERFQGSPINADTIAKIEAAIVASLTADGMFGSSSVVAKVLPIAGDTVVVVVAVPDVSNLPLVTFGMNVATGTVNQVQ